MCGIAGIVANRPVNSAAVQAMTDLLAHRGPDGEGLWLAADKRVGLGHRRLAVIDPTPGGAQPMADAAGTVVLTFNGEIYNYREIAGQLAEAGVVLRSQSDSEVLLEAYRQWGEACLDRLNGMFAFAIYDSRSGTLFCARDRFGEKPFLYVEGDGYFAFASEYKALFALEGVMPEIDELKLLRFLDQPRQGLDDQRETVFVGISQLLPGEKLSLNTTTLESRTSKYWSLQPNADLARLDDDDAAAAFRDLLADSVALRMRSDVPVGSCLSGGLDSSAIVGLNRRHLGDGPAYHVFTGRFPGTSADEWVYADEVIQANGVTSHVTEPRAEGFVADLADFIWFNELPMGSSSQYAQWCVFRLAKEAGITVLLDGQGADELLGGYEQYFAAYLSALGDTGEAAAIRQRYPLALEDAAGAWKKRLPSALRWRLANWSGKGSDFLFGLSPEIAARAAAGNQRSLRADLNPLSAALHDDAFHAHLPTLLRYGDRNSMAHSREVRLPFCDHRVAEFALSMPPEKLMGDAETKRLLRRSMVGVMPETVRTRWNKQGFLPPQDDWFRDRLLAMTRQTIDSDGFRERGCWNVSWWRRAVERFEAGEGHLAWTLWKPMIAEAWRTHFVARVAAMPKLSVFEC